MVKMIHISCFLDNLIMMNSYANVTNSNARVMNSIAKITNLIAKGTTSKQGRSPEILSGQPSMDYSGVVVMHTTQFLLIL